MVSSLLGDPGRNREGAPTEDPIVLLGDFKALMGSNSITWRCVTKRNGLNFCVAHRFTEVSMSTMGTMFCVTGRPYVFE